MDEQSKAPEPTKRSSPASWMAQFETREQKEIDLARLYAALYDHGSPGHLHLKIIAKLATELDRREGIETEYIIERSLVAVE